RSYVEELSQPTGTLRVGVARTKWGEVDCEPEVLNAVESTAALLEEMGHNVTDIEPPYEPIEYLRSNLAKTFFFATSLEETARTLGRP
ncbi:amidase, partial [Mesorhizobium sp. M8A.F.Ca.ET.213.01.1.1]